MNFCQNKSTYFLEIMDKNVILESDCETLVNIIVNNLI